MMVGERSRRRNRETGTTTIVIDQDKAAADPLHGDWIEADTRWVIICDEHGMTCGCETRRQAENFAAHPTEWCGDCYDERSSR